MGKAAPAQQIIDIMDQLLEVVRVYFPLVLVLFMGYMIVADDKYDRKFRGWIIVGCVVCYFILYRYVGSDVYKDECEIRSISKCEKGYYYLHIKKYY